MLYFSLNVLKFVLHNSHKIQICIPTCPNQVELCSLTCDNQVFSDNYLISSAQCYVCSILSTFLLLSHVVTWLNKITTESTEIPADNKNTR